MNTIICRVNSSEPLPPGTSDAREAAAFQFLLRFEGTDPYLGLSRFPLFKHHLEFVQRNAVFLNLPRRLRVFAGFRLFHFSALSQTVFHFTALQRVAFPLSAVTTRTLQLARGGRRGLCRRGSSSPQALLGVRGRSGAAPGSQPGAGDLLPNLSTAAPERFLPRLPSQLWILPLLLQYAQIPPFKMRGKIFCVLQRTRS